MRKIGIILSGIQGRMGQALRASLRDEKAFPNLMLGGGLESPGHEDLGTTLGKEIPPMASELTNVAKKNAVSVVIDFTTPSATLLRLSECLELNIPIIIGTTGFDEKGLAEIHKGAKRIPIVMAANFSVGVSLMAKVIEYLAHHLPETYDLEIVEAHHRLKKDAPSGTAWRLAEALAKGRGLDLKKHVCLSREGETGIRPKNQIGLQTLRGGDIVGDHTVFFAGPGERLEITHRAHTRENFAQGALRAAQWLWTGNERKKPGMYDMHDVLNLERGES